MIIEARGNYFNNTLYDELNILENAFPTLEWVGIQNASQIDSFLSHIFTPFQSQLIGINIGQNLHDLRIFTDGIIHDTSIDPDIYKHVDCTGKIWEHEFNIFLHKISQIYLRPEVQHLIDNKILDFAILDTIYNFIKCNGEIMSIGPIGEEIKQKSIIKAFTEVGILFQEKHMSYVNIRKTHLKFFKQYYTEKMREMSVLEKIEYNWWVLFKGLHIKDMAQNPKRDRNATHYQDLKYNANWDNDIYGEVGRRDDPEKEGTNLMNKPIGNLLFFNYGKFTEIPPIKYSILPITVFLSKIGGFPDNWLHLKRKAEKEGNPEPTPVNYVFKWLYNRSTTSTLLPKYGAESFIHLNTEQRERGLLKISYIVDNPEMFRKPIKWRYIRRYARQVYQGKK